MFSWDIKLWFVILVKISENDLLTARLKKIAEMEKFPDAVLDW